MILPVIPNPLLDDCVSPGEPLFPDLAVDSRCTEWVIPDPLIEVFLVVIQFSRFFTPLLSKRRVLRGDVFPYCSPIVPRLPGDLTDGHPLVVEISYHEKFLHF